MRGYNRQITHHSSCTCAIACVIPSESLRHLQNRGLVGAHSPTLNTENQKPVAGFHKTDYIYTTSRKPGALSSPLFWSILYSFSKKLRAPTAGARSHMWRFDRTLTPQRARHAPHSSFPTFCPHLHAYFSRFLPPVPLSASIPLKSQSYPHRPVPFGWQICNFMRQWFFIYEKTPFRRETHRIMGCTAQSQWNDRVNPHNWGVRVTRWERDLRRELSPGLNELK